MNGLIILPDGWSSSVYHLANVNQPTASFSSNIIGGTWNDLMQMNGAVFLPAAGKRDERRVEDVGSCGYYYTSEASVKKAFGYGFDHLVMGEMTLYRSMGLSVRLVRDMG